MNKEYLKRLFDANWTLEEVEEFKAQVIADQEAKTPKIADIIEIVQEWMGIYGIQSKYSSEPEQFIHCAPYTWAALKTMLTDKLNNNPQGGGTV